MRRMGALLFLAATTSAASAGVLPLDGAYGNETGCAFFATGEAGDDMILLTPDTYLDGQTGCDFDSMVEDDGVFGVRGVCATPGEASIQGDILKVRWEAGANAIVYDGLESIGPLLPCVTVVDPGFDA